MTKADSGTVQSTEETGTQQQGDKERRRSWRACFPEIREGWLQLPGRKRGQLSQQEKAFLQSEVNEQRLHTGLGLQPRTSDYQSLETAGPSERHHPARRCTERVYGTGNLLSGTTTNATSTAHRTSFREPS